MIYQKMTDRLAEVIGIDAVCVVAYTGKGASASVLIVPKFGEWPC